MPLFLIYFSYTREKTILLKYLLILLNHQNNYVERKPNIIKCILFSVSVIFSKLSTVLVTVIIIIK